LAPATRPDSLTAPVAAVRAAKAAGLEGRVFSAYPFSGYLLFQGILPFVDSRVDFYGDVFMTAFRAAYYQPSDSLAKLLDRYEIGWAIVEADSPAARFLNDLPGWTRVYDDKVAVVYRRS